MNPDRTPKPNQSDLLYGSGRQHRIHSFLVLYYGKLRLYCGLVLVFYLWSWFLSAFGRDRNALFQHKFLRPFVCSITVLAQE